jgi:hypothetical protein
MLPAWTKPKCLTDDQISIISPYRRCSVNTLTLPEKKNKNNIMRNALVIVLRNTGYLLSMIFFLIGGCVYAQSDRFGVHATDLVTAPLIVVDKVAKKLDSANVRWVRINIAWQDVEAVKGNWNWSDLEDRIAILKSCNINILCLLYKIPAWASSAPVGTDSIFIPYYAPKDTSEWMTYIDSTVTRFRNSISSWEIWNEPDGGFFYVPDAGTKATRYFELLRTAHRAIKNIDPSAQVVFAGLTSQIAEYPRSIFIDSVMALGAADYFDIMNVHFYRHGDTPVQKVKSVLAGYGKNSPVWVTETNNWRSLLPENTEQRAADSLSPWLDNLLSVGPEKIFWFNLTNFQGSGSPDSIAWGLFAKPLYTPTTVYTAYANYISSATGIPRQLPVFPAGIQLNQNYPNPFNPSTTISFSVPKKSHVLLKIYDLIGREVAELVNKELPAGSYTSQWNAVHAASGIYFYRLQAGSLIETKKLVLLR